MRCLFDQYSTTPLFQRCLRGARALDESADHFRVEFAFGHLNSGVQRVRVVVETLDNDMPLARLAEEGGAFSFLGDEPDLYSEADIRPS